MPKKAGKTTRTGTNHSATAASMGSRGLVIVESPAKAKTISRYLGGNYVVTASMGHVRDLPSRTMGVDIEHDFTPTYEITPDRRKTIAQLKKQANKADIVYLATDLDREGEAIAWHLAEALALPDDRIRRVVFNEITRSAIQAAFEQARVINHNRVYAQQARRILDRIVGYEISPLLWRKVAPGLSAGRVQSVAVRLIVDREREINAFMPEEFWRMEVPFSVDLPGAAACGQAWRQFMATADEKGNPPTRQAQAQWLAQHGGFWSELTHWQGQRVDLSDATKSCLIAEALGLKIESIERSTDPNAKGPAANLVKLKTSLYGPGSTELAVKLAVETLSKRQTTSKPPTPFTTASLQQAASTQLRFAASRTMQVAQQLYEGVELGAEGSVGLITYMRTDSLNLAGEAVAAARSFINDEFGGKYLPEKPNRYSAAGRAQEAHEAIRPTNVTRRPEDLRNNLTEAQYRLYKLIWSRFVACQMTPAVWSVTDAVIAADTTAGKAQFKAVGRQLLFDGFMMVTGVYSIGGDQILPAMQENQPVAPIDIIPTQRFTQPPPRYTEASLVKTLEAEGIGRPSTYANIIQTIQDRGYAEQRDRRFFATAVGMKVTDKLVEYFPLVMDLRFTAHMEDQLDGIEDATQNWVTVLKEFYGPFKEKLDHAREQMQPARAETEPSEYVCEECGKPMVYRWSKNGKYLACTGYPECKKTHPVDLDGKKVAQKIVAGACPECGADMIQRRSKFGPFLGCVRYPECKGTCPCDQNGDPLRVVKDDQISGECPKCGSKTIVKRKGRRAFLGCQRYPECDGTSPIPEGVHLAPPPKAPVEDTGLICPKCGKKNLVIRQGPRGRFVACSGFPKCRNSFNLELLEQVATTIQAKGDAQSVIDGDKAGRKPAKKAKTAKKSKTAGKAKTTV
ncbi:MAG: type I DNA topoisomerase [Planctomycetes bacterium]|nr:type I DNA topoisomerase [Planctomycetota bacterium]